MVPSIKLEVKRFITAYIPLEDRLRLSVECQTGQHFFIWITHRLSKNMVDHLYKSFSKSSQAILNLDSLKYVLNQSGSQQNARLELLCQSPVKAHSDCPQWLVHKVDIQSKSHGMRLVFHGADVNDQLALGMGFTPLRQWLGILHDQYRLAGWSTGMWPTWVSESALPPKPSTKTVLH